VSSEKGGSSLVTVRQTGDDGDYELVVKDGKVSAKIDGQPVPDDRIIQEGGQVRLLDDDGNVVATFHVGGGGAYTVFGGAPRVVTRDELFGGGGAGGWAQTLMVDPQQSAPKVMLGVTMSDAPAEVLRYFRIEPPVGIQLDRVYEGLPASKAGLESRDIVVRVEGVGQASQDELRSILRTKEPGDQLKLKVLRKGDAKDVTVTLEKYDAKKLGIELAPNVQFWGEGEDGEQFEALKRFGAMRGFELGEEQKAHAQQAIEQALAALGDIDQEAVSEQARKAIEQAMKQLEKSDQWTNQLKDLDFQFQVDPEVRIRVFTDEDGEVFALPGGGGGASTFEWRKADDRLQELDERLRRLEEKLGRLEKMIGNLAGDR
jgi:hypothetical protein